MPLNHYVAAGDPADLPCCSLNPPALISSTLWGRAPQTNSSKGCCCFCSHHLLLSARKHCTPQRPFPALSYQICSARLHRTGSFRHLQAQLSVTSASCPFPDSRVGFFPSSQYFRAALCLLLPPMPTALLYLAISRVPALTHRLRS